MNWIDLLIILVLIFFVFEGIGRSFLGEVLDFLSFAVSFLLSLRFYNSPALIFEENFQIPHSLSNILGFISIWFISEVVFFAIIQILIFKVAFLNNLNKKLSIFAVIPSILRGVVFVSILLLVVGTFPIQPNIKLAVTESRFGSKILSYTTQLEAPVKNVFGGLTQDTLTFLTIKPKSNETINIGFVTLEFAPNEALEKEMVQLVNTERAGNGFRALTFDTILRDTARLHSADMFRKGYFSHYGPDGKNVADRAKKFGAEFKIIGENLAYAPNLELAHKGLMNSEGHRANILSEDFGKMGIGIMDGGVYGLMITQVFSD